MVWRHNGVEISSYDPNYSTLQDFALQVNSVSDLSAGTYTVSANTGVGAWWVGKHVEEGFIQKRRQRSSLLLGGHNCFSSLPRYLFCTRAI